jgi:hypothetical protein
MADLDKAICRLILGMVWNICEIPMVYPSSAGRPTQWMLCRRHTLPASYAAFCDVENKMVDLENLRYWPISGMVRDINEIPTVYPASWGCPTQWMLCRHHSLLCLTWKIKLRTWKRRPLRPIRESSVSYQLGIQCAGWPLLWGQTFGISLIYVTIRRDIGLHLTFYVRRPPSCFPGHRTQRTMLT